MEKADILHLLQIGTIEIEGLLPWSSNYTFLVRVCGADVELEAVYKPRKGERPLWDFPQGTLCQRERAAFLVSDSLGWDVVPPTTLRDGPHGLGSLQFFVEHDPENHYFAFEEEQVLKPQLRKIVLLDHIINNADRKGGHILVEEIDDFDEADKLWAIDHGICFHIEPKLRTVIWEFAGETIAPDLLLDLKTLQGESYMTINPLSAQLNELLSNAELKVMKQRLDRLIRNGIFPRPGPGRHYPWPPV